MNQVQVGSALLVMKDRIPLDESTLVSQLNTLLTSLRIPIPLISPTDLTPRLLIAILESILGIRIPSVERQHDSQISKVQNIKIFMGVLETDILQVDVGLSLLDPRRLACGEREEVMFIAELLCWVGRRMKLIEPKKIKTPADVFPSHAQAREPQPSTPIVATANQSSRSDFSPAAYNSLSQLDVDAASVFQTNSTWTERSTPLNDSPFTTRPFDNESFTSLNTDDHPLLQPPFQPNIIEAKKKVTKDDDALSSVSDILTGLPETWKPLHRERPRCIHEIPSPSSVLNSRNKLPSTPPRESIPNFPTSWCPEHSKDFCMCRFSGRSPPVRYSGYIEPVDEDSELASFELSRSISTTSEPSFDTLLHVGSLSIVLILRQC
jgi:hypothetical protein